MESNSPDHPREPEVLAGPETPGKPRNPVDAVLKFIGAYSIAITVFLLLIVLTLLGTFSQKTHGLYDSQRWYFESWIVPAEGRPWGIPLPGVALLLAVLFVNLFAGGILRVRKNKKTIGVIISHFSMLGLIAAGAVSLYTKTEGHMKIDEGQTSDLVQAFQDWVVEVREIDGSDKNVSFIRETDFRGATGAKPRTFFRSGWPFEFKISGYERNAVVVPGSEPALPGGTRAVDGFALYPQKVSPQNEANLAGVVLDVLDLTGKPVGASILGSMVIDQEIINMAARPYTFTAGGRTFAVAMTREQWQLPFKVKLDDFVAEYYPGTRKPKAYESHVTVLKGADKTEETKFLIHMNTPLRDSGYVAYQTSFDDQSPPGQERYTVLTVVKNPSDQWPFWCLVVSGIGLAIHFCTKLGRFIGRSTPVRQPS